MKQQDDVYDLISLSASSHKGDAFYVMTMFLGKISRNSTTISICPGYKIIGTLKNLNEVEGCCCSHLLQGGDLTKDTRV